MAGSNPPGVTNNISISFHYSMDRDTIYSVAYNAAKQVISDYNMADDSAPKPVPPKKKGEARMKEIEREHARMMRDHKKFEKDITRLRLDVDKIKAKLKK
jgi:hypothetical protein